MFHVPESSRMLDGPLASTSAEGNNGAFVIDSPEPGWSLVFIASDGDEWEHVSVRASRADGRSRIPSWKEMCFVKDVCWDSEAAVMQIHPPRSAYVNNHPHVLHLWRSTVAPLPMPPMEMV